MIKGHGGNIQEAAASIGCDPEEIVDMSSNLNPLGPPPGLIEHLHNHMEAVLSLPEVDAAEIVTSVATEYGIGPEKVLAGNGTTEIIYTIAPALATKKALIVGPTYADYASSCRMHGVDHDFFLARPEDDFIPPLAQLGEIVPAYDTVFICNPNNPTGAILPVAEIAELARNYPQTWFIVDESYLPFVDGPLGTSIAMDQPQNVLVLNSMSKIFRIAGLRVGFLIAAEPIIKRFAHFCRPWTVNAMAQEAVRYIGGNRGSIAAFLAQSRFFFTQEKQRFISLLQKKDTLQLYPGATYFILAKITSKMTGAELCTALLQEKILIRDCSNFPGLKNNFVRFSLKDSQTNTRLAQALKLCC